MLAHSPSLPLTVEYISNNDITAEDEEGIMLALGHQDRVRELCIVFPVWNLQKLFVAIDEEFPILEYLILVPSVFESTVLMLPETLQPPRLRHLILMGFAYPIQPRLHPTAVGLVTLFLTIIHPSAYFHPSVLLQWISFMPHLETLAVYFSFFIPDLDVEGAERQLTHMPITTPITLPNLRMLALNCISTYLEVFICQITTPRLEHLIIQFFKQLTFSIPHLMQFLNTTEGLRFDSVELEFSDKRVDVQSHLHESGETAFSIGIHCWGLDWQLSSVAQVSNELNQVFSTVDYLTLEHKAHSQSSEERNEADCSELRKLLKSFGNVKTLLVEDGLVEEVSRCLQLEDGEDPLELFPKLQELTYFRNGAGGDAFMSFIDARENAGHPLTLVRRSPSPSPVSL